MLSFDISKWSFWLDGAPVDKSLQDVEALASGVTSVNTIPSILRRRLSGFGRVCLSQMLALNANQSTPVVYCSRHGDITRATAVLTALSCNEAVSPMQFSLAVHNAIGGVYSIHTGATANLSAIASGDEPLLPTIVEAYGLLQESGWSVLCVIADTSLPPVYQKAELSSVPTHSLAFMLTSGDRFSLSLLEQKEIPLGETGLDQVLNLADLIAGKVNQIECAHNDSCWGIKRAA